MSTFWERLHKLKSLAVIGVLILIIIGLTRNLIGFAKTKDRFSQAKQTVSKLEGERQALQSQLDLEDSEYVTEKQLRDALGLAKPGEVVVIIPEEMLKKGMEQKQEDADSTKDVVNWQRWMKLFR